MHEASLPQGDLVPQPDDRLVAVVVFKAEFAHAGRFAEEAAACPRGQAEPAGGDHADDVAAGEGQYIAAEVTHLLDESISAAGDVLGGFAVGAAIAKEFPAGPIPDNVAGQLPFVDPVIPFE